MILYLLPQLAQTVNLRAGSRILTSQPKKHKLQRAVQATRQYTQNGHVMMVIHLMQIIQLA